MIVRQRQKIKLSAFAISANCEGARYSYGGNASFARAFTSLQKRLFSVICSVFNFIMSSKYILPVI